MMTMGGGDRRTEAIMREIAALRAEREELDRRILFFESQLRVGDTAASPAMLPPPTNKLTNAVGLHAGAASLSSDVIRRYSGHLLLPDFGIQGQKRLARSSVLVVGAGGLGSAVATYLAACGVGTLGIVDGDDVELGNLHRQTMHVEAYVGQPKVKSAAAACRGINSSVKVLEYHLKLKPKNALDVVRQYDIVVDATNSLPSRYMLSDCCVLLKKPLVSGSAFGLEGQVSVYNHNKSPCYRCLFPNPPASAPCQSHSDSGILGVVPGVIGCLQALEVIKVATGVGEPLCGRMLLFDALSSRFKTVKIHRRLSTNCTICGENATLNEEAFTTFDYDIFIQTSKSGKPTSLDPLPENARVTSREYKQLRDSGKPHLLLDVRPAHHFQIASIPNSLNIPLQELEERLPRLRDALNEVADSLRGKQRPLYFICRRGDDSQVAVRMLRENGFLYATAVNGGLESWVREVDPGFPAYW
ncbi:hypothetical protein QOZ80_2BG0204690 [Eleusine coracana subsp. coracana]|nr:hypothetical protein QOZ80_2BG0204690 [Eleusine coracana subsp. coracana]